MLVMRPASAEDSEPIVAMTQARADWLGARGLNGQGWREFAPEYGRQAADSYTPMWVLTRDGQVMGATCLYEESPAWFWTPEECAEPAYFVASTVTDPAFAGQGLGHLMLRWVLDHAARTGRDWVRRGTIEPGLVRYYTQVQGWQVVREQERGGVTVVGLTRRAELQPDLPVLTGTPVS
ncbi:GNAT family N-acetyltransferase [Actinoallomurus sp. NPDC052308]|uniref:GNAT family N-acetyltransferase n=1 Tax=Actinoallomurus sp. NPDC052308 TaxID=3155530 RepID=UPI003432CBCD